MLIRRKTPDVIRRKTLGCSQRKKSFDEFDAFNMCRLYIESQFIVVLGVGNVEVDSPE